MKNPFLGKVFKAHKSTGITNTGLIDPYTEPFFILQADLDELKSIHSHDVYKITILFADALCIPYYCVKTGWLLDKQLIEILEK